MISGSTCDELTETLRIATVDIIFEYCKYQSSRTGKPKLHGGRSENARGHEHSEQQYDGRHLGDGGMTVYSKTLDAVYTGPRVLDR
jgi:hypothetical protein